MKVSMKKIQVLLGCCLWLLLWLIINYSLMAAIKQLFFINDI